MEDFNIKISIKLIKERIEKIFEILKNKNADYFYEAIKLNLIEIGEESKNLNDYLKKNFGKWNDIISKEYNFRISLTHYYAGIDNSIIDKHLENDFPNFVNKINELEKNEKEKNIK
jgi:uncharacterized protein with HEPN domain